MNIFWDGKRPWMQVIAKMIILNKKMFLNGLTLQILAIVFLPFALCSQVKADFLFDKSEGCGSLAVSFTDQSTTNSGSIVDWKWDLGGTFSSKQNPGIIFTSPGEYTICLTVTNSVGNSSTICKNNLIKIFSNPIADFTVDQKAGCSPVKVLFDDLSKSSNGHIISWIWDIGGSSNVVSNTDSTVIIGTTYSAEGNYSATLSITDNKGCKHTITKPNLVTVSTIPNLTVDYSLINACDLPWEIKFTNLDPDPNADYFWNFENGQTYTGQNPPNIFFNEAKSYTISVIIHKGACIDTITFENLINTIRSIDFKIESLALCARQEIQLKDISNFASDSLVWDFGDGNTSTQANPSHIYNFPGCYKIKLTKFIKGCVQSVEKPCIIVHPEPKVNFELVNGFSCLIPAPVKLNASADINGNFTWNVNGPGISSTFQGDSIDINLLQFGQYKVDLLFKAENGCTVSIKDELMDITKFEASLPSLGPKGCIPFNAVLTDSISSNVALTSWKWEIGNPVIFSSTNQNPVYKVTEVGRWDLRLIVENIYGCKDTIVRKEYIQGGEPPIIDFVATPLDDCLAVPRQFNSSTNGLADYWIWTYNDTTVFSNEKDPLYTFNNFGIFDISLTVFQNGCGNKFTRADYINVFKPVSSFDVVYRCDDPYTIDIQNLSLGADSLYWVVKLSETVTDTIRDSLLNTYTFPDRGLYFLTHYGKSLETGCEHIRIDSIFIVDLKASYTLDTIRGCAPLNIKVSSTIQDAVSSEFLPGQFSIIESDDSEAIVTYTEGGTLFGPQLKVVDRHGCIDTFQTSTPVEISKINTQIEAPDVVCVPGGVQMKDLSIPGLGTIIDREWFFSLNDQKSVVENPYFDIPIEGNHFATLNLTDSWGCKDSIRKEVLAVTLIPAFSSDTLSCTDRGVRFKIDSDPTFLDAFIWDFGDNMTSTDKNPLHFFDQEGVYDVCAELFDSRGCSKKTCKPKQVLIKNPKAGFTADPTAAPCPPLLTNFSDFSINTNKYTWDFGDDSGVSYNQHPSHVYTSPGSFGITLYAEMMPGCVDTLYNPDFIQLLGPTAKIEYEIIGNCVPLEVRLNAESDKKYEFIWDYGDGKINAVPGLLQTDTTSYIYDKTGRFVPKLLVSDDNGCSRTFTIDPIFVNDILPKIESQFIPFCGLPVEVTIENKTTSTSSDLKYSWTLIGNITYLSQEETPNWDIKSYGKYSVQMIVSAANCVDTLTQDSIFEVASFPSVNFEILSSLLCENIEVSLLNASVSDYGMINSWNWDFGEGITSTDPTPNATFTKPGNYNITLKVATDKGCEEMLSKTVTVLPNTLIDLRPNKTICIGDSLDVSASVISSDVYTFGWTENPLIKCLSCENINVKPNATTVFYFHTSSQSGCSNQDSIIVTVIPIPGPILQLSSDTIVCENSSIEISILNFNNQYTYQWDNQDAGLNCYSNCASVLAAPNDDTYFSIVVTNSFGCFKEDSILVTVERNIEDFLKPTKAICESDSTAISISGGNQPIWEYDPTMSCSICPDPLVYPDKNTYYTVTVISDAGCTYRDSILVEIIPLSSIDAGTESTICKGETIPLNGKGIGEIEWYSTSSIINKNNLQATSKPDISTVFYLKATKDECILSDSVLINVILKTEISGVGDTICPKDIAIMYAFGNAQSFDWYKDDKKIGERDSIVVEPIKTTDYKVIGRRGLCQNDTSIVTVLVHPAIDYRQLEDNYEVYINSKVKLEANFDENADYVYHWSPADGLNCIDCPEPFAKNLEQSIKYFVTVKDIYGCEIEQQVFIKYNDECSKDGFYIPNIFTPYNRDGHNDVFKVYAEDEAEFISISMFDRWGEKVYTSSDTNATWDGMYQGRELMQGVFTFIITARCDKTNEIFNFAGDVTILR